MEPSDKRLENLKRKRLTTWLTVALTQRRVVGIERVCTVSVVLNSTNINAYLRAATQSWRLIRGENNHAEASPCFIRTGRILKVYSKSFFTAGFDKPKGWERKLLLPCSFIKGASFRKYISQKKKAFGQTMSQSGIQKVCTSYIPGSFWFVLDLLTCR